MRLRETDLTVLHHKQVICKSRCLILIVSRHDDGYLSFLLHFADDAFDDIRVLLVYGGGRLVEKENFRFYYKCPGNAEPLGFAARNSNAFWSFLWPNPTKSRTLSTLSLESLPLIPLIARP
jgi:hypothetical protein